MPELDDLLNPASGRDLAAGAGMAAHPGDVDGLLRRGARRGRRARTVAVAGVAAATVLAVGVGVGVSGGLSADAPPPMDRPSQPTPPDSGETLDPEELADMRVRDLTPEQLVARPGSEVASAAIGEDLDDRAVVWSAPNARTVLATTTDGGDSWSYEGDPGTFHDLRAVPGGDGQFLVSESFGPTELRDVDGEGDGDGDGDGDGVTLTGTGPLGPLAEGEFLADVTRQRRTSQLAVAPDGSAHPWPGDPLLEEQRTGVVGSWSSAVQQPTGVVVQEVAGAQVEVDGRCCLTTPELRWSSDGGASWTTGSLGILLETVPLPPAFGFTRVVPSLDPDVLAVHTVSEGGAEDRVVGTKRWSVDGSTAEVVPTFDGDDVAWSVVLAGGGLLAWSDGTLLLSQGDDWTRMEPVAGASAPAGVDGDALELVDVRSLDGAPRIVAVTPDGHMLVVDGLEPSWSRVDGR